MRIALDYREAADKNRAGKGEHIYQLAKAFATTAPPDVEFVLLVSPGQKVDLPKFRYQTVTIPARGALWHVLVTAWLSIARPVDLYFSTTSVIIPAFAIGVPVVTILFDFTSWRFGQTHNAHAHWIERGFMKLAARRSRKLIAISNFTKQEAVELLSINADNIVVTPLAVDTSVFKPETVVASVKQRLVDRYKLPDRYIMCLATVEPRKNMVAIIAAFKRIRDKYPDLHLVLAGGRGWHTQKILKEADERIVVTGYIADEDRVPLYNLTEVFVFPSIYEGFGIPPLEAMACGIPTIVSDRASLPEVAGPVAVQISLDDPKLLDHAIEEFLNMPQGARAKWAAQAMGWANQFSWKTTATKTLDVLLQYGKR